MKTKGKYRFIEFVRPDSYWPYPYSIEQAFGVFGWMVKSGIGYVDHCRWGRQDVLSLLSCKPTCVNFTHIDPITSVDDLRRRFHYALLSAHVGPELQRWRIENRITPDGVATIVFPHSSTRIATHKCSACQGVDGLLKATGRLGVQLNRFHPHARNILGVRLHFYGRTWRFVLKYGYDGSSWDKTLARQLPGETFYTAFRRASKNLEQLVGGAGLEASA